MKCWIITREDRCNMVDKSEPNPNEIANILFDEKYAFRYAEEMRNTWNESYVAIPANILFEK